METGEQKMHQNIFSMDLKDRICKIKKYLNYMLMIISKITISNPKVIIKFAKKFMKNLTTRRPLPKLLLLNFLAKLLAEKKCI